MEFTVSDRWLALFDGLAELAEVRDPRYTDVARLNSLLGSVRMVQPFDWMQWNAPRPELHEIWDLSVDDCVRHVTRVVRADRTNEGVLWAGLRSGALTLLCSVARNKSSGVISNLSQSLNLSSDPKSVE